MTIHDIAKNEGASVLVDRDGDVALLRRHYDADGREEVRYAPDPCHYHKPEAWEQASARQCAEWIC